MSITDYFETERIKNALQRYINHLEGKEFENEFQQNIRGHILNALTSFLNNTYLWDEKSQFNIGIHGDRFYNILIDLDSSQPGLNKIFTACLRFVLEASLFNETHDHSGFAKDMQSFAVYNMDKFDDSSKNQIKYSLYEMPISVVRNFLNSNDVNTYRKFLETVKNANEMEKKWRVELDERQEAVSKLSEVLKNHKDAFNFVGLYSAFSELGRKKQSELSNTKLLLFLLGSVLTLPILGEAFFFSFYSKPGSITDHLMTSIPVLSLTLILIYFFRVVLSNFNSIRAQLMQIELRKSLCQFIQNYAEYSKEIRTSEANPLTKFEDIIFSNIMGSDEKTPSTFDGIEQLAGMIKAIKNK